VSDLLFVSILVGFFLLAGMFVRGCDRIIGAEDEAPVAPRPFEADGKQGPA
jgi:hypothetical protein